MRPSQGRQRSGTSSSPFSNTHKRGRAGTRFEGYGVFEKPVDCCALGSSGDSRSTSSSAWQQAASVSDEADRTGRPRSHGSGRRQPASRRAVFSCSCARAQINTPVASINTAPTPAGSVDQFRNVEHQPQPTAAQLRHAADLCPAPRRAGRVGPNVTALAHLDFHQTNIDYAIRLGAPLADKRTLASV